ncbi:MAG TPA: magnesium/cobalt transporter CorA [Candidatus Binataceae bacterium]|jgi:magnesium transporter|nr:magnesium/cobalt transporter CorA [Candidatus Binataceae bacterium]
MAVMKGSVYRTIRIKGKVVEVHEDAASVAPPPPGEQCWIDVQLFEAADLKILHERFGFHPLAIEDCTNTNQRAKVDEYDSYLFIVQHAMEMGKADGEMFTIEELSAFIGDHYLVTVHQKPIKQVDAVWRHAVSEGHSDEQGVDFLLYLITDALIDDAFPIIDELSDRLESIEAEILDGVEQSQLIRLLGLKRDLITLRRTLAPERDVLSILARRGDPRISEKSGLFFRDVYDHAVRAYEQIDVERDLLGNAMEAYISMMQNRTNIIMKQLTIFASIFLPLTFLTGFFGQNFSKMPYESHSLYYAMLTICIMVPVGMVYWFWRRNWL